MKFSDSVIFCICHDFPTASVLPDISMILSRSCGESEHELGELKRLVQLPKVLVPDFSPSSFAHFPWCWLLPHWVRCYVLNLIYVLKASKPNLTDLVDLAASLADNRSNHVIGHRHFMSSWDSDYSRYPRWFFGEMHQCKKPEIPVPTVIPPRPATTPSGTPGKVCYCVERSAEQ